MTRLLFVCSGNITRSPAAAALADQHALRRAIEIEVRSAGTLLIEGSPAHPQMVAVARQVGLDLSTHSSSGLTADLLRWADFVAAMEPSHLDAIEHLVPEARGRSRGLGTYVGRPQIDDPTGSWFAGPYRRTLDELDTAVERFLFDVIRES